MNKLEKVAIRRAKKTGRPIVLVFNNIHLFNNDDEGRLLLQQLQQRAENWAESCQYNRIHRYDLTLTIQSAIVTMVFLRYGLLRIVESNISLKHV
jgi:GTPase SAR1 family protein